jgi:hypothetical protein
MHKLVNVNTSTRNSHIKDQICGTSVNDCKMGWNIAPITNEPMILDFFLKKNKKGNIFY